MNDLLAQLLKKEEAVKLEPYRDHLGFWTVGVGHLIDRRKGGYLPDFIRAFPITADECDAMLEQDIEKVEQELTTKLPLYASLDAVRKLVLASMVFQMGITGLLGFKRTLAAVERGDYAQAADLMTDSKWYMQTRQRAERLRMAMLTGDAADLLLA